MEPFSNVILEKIFFLGSFMEKGKRCSPLERPVTLSAWLTPYKYIDTENNLAFLFVIPLLPPLVLIIPLMDNDRRMFTNGFFTTRLTDPVM